MALSNGTRVVNMNASNNLVISSGEVFIKSISAATTFTFTELTETKLVRLIITNTAASDLTFALTYPGGWTNSNGSDLMTRLRAGRTQVYEFVLDTTTNKFHWIAPLRLESIYAP